MEFPPILDSQDQKTDLSAIPLPLFAAISYPWRDLQLPAGSSTPSFSVAGALHADPISMSVIRTACFAARVYNCSYLWLDRLCILQESKEDKDWQIQRMFHVYRRCATCLVFPGGLVRLARLDDATSWIDRAWTLQEAVAPQDGTVKVVFALTHPTYREFIQERCDTEKYNERCHAVFTSDLRFDTKAAPHGTFVERVLEPDRSAVSDLNMLRGEIHSWLEALREHGPDFPDLQARLPIRILRGVESLTLSNAVAFRTGLPLWTAAYTRSSSRPVDMVFSIMGLFGVHLDVSRFGKTDRLYATIALIQEMMRRPRATATWLYIAPTMTPSKELSTLPEMPETSESGCAYIHTPKGRVPATDAIAVETFFESSSWDTRGAPRGEMTDSGYFVFWSRAAPMPVDTASTGRGIGTAWAGVQNSYDDREVWAVVVGRKKNFNRNPDTWEHQSWSGEGPRPVGLFELTLMLIEKHGHELYHRVGMEREIDERKTAGWNWTYRRFQVGGPGRGERQRFNISSAGPVYVHINREEELASLYQGSHFVIYQ